MTPRMAKKDDYENMEHVRVLRDEGERDGPGNHNLSVARFRSLPQMAPVVARDCSEVTQGKRATRPSLWRGALISRYCVASGAVAGSAAGSVGGVRRFGDLRCPDRSRDRRPAPPAFGLGAGRWRPPRWCHPNPRGRYHQARRSQPPRSPLAKPRFRRGSGLGGVFGAGMKSLPSMLVRRRPDAAGSPRGDTIPCRGSHPDQCAAAASVPRAPAPPKAGSAPKRPPPGLRQLSLAGEGRFWERQETLPTNPQHSLRAMPKGPAPRRPTSSRVSQEKMVSPTGFEPVTN